jgi:CheY-like chemotaxis protein
MHILLVDDDEDILCNLSDLFQDAGYQTFMAGNGAEALQVLKAFTVAGIILDLMMPVMNGWEFLEEKKKDPAIAGIPVIIVSAYADSVPDNMPLLRKPYSPGVLLEMTRAFA